MLVAVISGTTEKERIFCKTLVHEIHKSKNDFLDKTKRLNRRTK